LDSIKLPNEIHLFIESYPKTVRKNILFRMKLHDFLAKDKEAQKDFISMVKLNPIIFYDLVAWTYNPRKPIGEMNVPFIVSARPSQVKAVNGIRDVNWQQNIALNKSRDEGATELLMKYITLMILFVPDVNFIIGSRSEELVDKTGDPSTLYGKIDYAIRFLPNWLTKRLHMERNFKHIRNLDINSTIDGEATNENFAAGKRCTALILDEFGRVMPNLAASIDDTIKDVSDCIIYNSTHWYGAGHIFNKSLKRKSTKVITLPWWENPEKNKGLHYADDEDVEWPRKERSPWFDGEVDRRTRRDIMMNLWMNPEGASDQFFDPIINEKIRVNYVKPPRYRGDISFETEKKKPLQGTFISKVGRCNFRWYDTLINNRPNQTHNYIVGCDIGFGTGASNSTAMITDANTGEEVGEYVCADKTPEMFADLVTALCLWIGGTQDPFLIWERTGGQGINFGRRVLENGYTHVYTKTTEQTKSRKRLNIYGWDNTGGPNGSKEDMLEQLQIALKEGIKEKPEHKFIIIRSEEVVNELNGYIFYSSGELNSSEVVDETSGARKRHGDRVIGTGLCVLGMLDFAAAKNKDTPKAEYGSLAWRMEQRKNEETRKKQFWGEPLRQSGRW